MDIYENENDELKALDRDGAKTDSLSGLSKHCVVKHGRSAAGKQRYCCRNSDCPRRAFILNFSYRGLLREVKVQISDMAINGSGIRDTARVLRISPTTVIETLKKSPSQFEQVNTTLLEQHQPDSEAVMVVRLEEAEMDEMWSFVGSKQQSAVVVARH